MFFPASNFMQSALISFVLLRNSQFLAAAMLGLAFSPLLSPSLWAQRRPPAQANIVILLADDLGYGEIGQDHPDQIPTPNIQKLLDTGVYCSQAYVTASNCSPSRAGLLTGRVGTRFGYEFNPIGARNDDKGVGLPSAEKTIAEVLKEVGYTTGLIGKWHLGGTTDFHPQRHGFDEFFGFLHEGHYFAPPPWNDLESFLRKKVLPGKMQGTFTSRQTTYSTHMASDEPPYDANNPILRSSQSVLEKEYLTDAFTREGIDFIDRHSDKPFLLMMSYNAVHSPMQSTADRFGRHASIKDRQRRIFAGMLSGLDDSVGQILKALEDRGLREKTLVVFLSDNGGPTRELTSSNLPLRGEKGQMYEGGLRIPFVISWPGKLAGGASFDLPISSLDILPTAASIAAAESPKGVDGVNLIPYLSRTANGAPHPELYWRQGKRAALRQGNWKIVLNSDRQSPLVWELFDLNADPGETKDLATKELDLLNKLTDRWTDINGQMIESLW